MMFHKEVLTRVPMYDDNDIISYDNQVLWIVPDEISKVGGVVRASYYNRFHGSLMLRHI